MPANAFTEIHAANVAVSQFHVLHYHDKLEQGFHADAQKMNIFFALLYASSLSNGSILKLKVKGTIGPFPQTPALQFSGADLEACGSRRCLRYQEPWVTNTWSWQSQGVRSIR